MSQPALLPVSGLSGLSFAFSQNWANGHAAPLPTKQGSGYEDQLVRCG